MLVLCTQKLTAGASPSVLMGNRVDAEKLHEAATLYAHAAQQEGLQEAPAFDAALQAVSGGVPHPRVVEVLAAEAEAAARASQTEPGGT